MLIVASSMRQLRFGDLSVLYNYNLPQESEFYSYLYDVFFRTKGAVYCVWEEKCRYVCALRLEPYRDGLILTGLETHPDFRNMGLASKLVTESLQWAGRQGKVKVYSHIHHSNVPSVAVHLRNGFRKIDDIAVLLDGSISSTYGTYLCELIQP